MIEHLKLQIEALKVRLDTDLFFLRERNSLIGDSEDILTLASETYGLIYASKEKIKSNENSDAELTLEAVKALAAEFCYQKFKSELDNIVERGIFKSYNLVAFTIWYMDKEDIGQSLHCLCVANRTYGSTLSSRSSHYIMEIGKKLNKANGSKGGTTTAKAFDPDREIVINEWETRKYHSYTACADELRRYNKDGSQKVSAAHKTILKWIGEYEKNKKLSNKLYFTSIVAR